MYDETLATEIITQIREGATLREISRARGMPEWLEMVDGLKDGECMVGEKTFNQAYNAAMEDRRLAWMDQNIADIKDLKLRGDRTDNAKLRQAEALINARAKLLRDQDEATKRVVGGAGGVNVVIRTFAPVGPDA